MKRLVVLLVMLTLLAAPALSLAGGDQNTNRGNVGTQIGEPAPDPAQDPEQPRIGDPNPDTENEPEK